LTARESSPGSSIGIQIAPVTEIERFASHWTVFLHIVGVAAAQGRHNGLYNLAFVPRHRRPKRDLRITGNPLLQRILDFPNIPIKIVVHLTIALLVLIFVEVGIKAPRLRL
jgi:hypothetical protein